MKQQYIVFIICVILAAATIWREVQRERKSNLLLRIVAVLIAIAALACMILPVSYQSSIDVNNEHSAVLLTEGYHIDSISHINTKIYTLSRSVKAAYPKAVLIGGVEELSQAKPVVTHLKVYGYGLDPDQLKQLNNFPITFNTAGIPEGISAVSWNANIKAGEPLHVQGTYTNSGQMVKLVLKGLGTTIDSTFIDDHKTADFNLVATPKHEGRAVFKLLAIRNTDTLENGSIPFEISPVKPLKVLILASAPDFENNFLKNWLTAKGYGVAVRNMISKDKFSQDFVNIAQQSLQHITASTLAQFDVLLSDLDLFKTLNLTEGAAIKQQVEQRGLGIIVRADSTNSSDFWLQRNFPSAKASSQGQVVTSLVVQNQAGSKAKLLIDPVYITYHNYTQPLVSDPQGHILASSALAGSGRVVFTTLNNTHSLMLSGDEGSYTALWSALITRAARRTTVNEQWLVKTPMPGVNTLTDLQLESPVPGQAVKVNQDDIPFSSIPELPYALKVSYWPHHAGWQQVQQSSGAPKWWFVYPANEWVTLKRLNRLNDTRKYAAKFNNNLTVTKQIHQKVSIAIPKIYFYVLLLAACIYLWVEAKFLS